MASLYTSMHTQVANRGPSDRIRLIQDSLLTKAPAEAAQPVPGALLPPAERLIGNTGASVLNRAPAEVAQKAAAPAVQDISPDTRIDLFTIVSRRYRNVFERVGAPSL